MDTIHSRDGCAPNREQQIKSRKCLSVDQCKEVNQKSSYVNFSKAVLDFARKDLNRSEKDLFELLSAEAVFSKDKSIVIKNKYIAKKTQRSVRTVTRLLSSLVKSGYIERELRAGKSSLIRVRLPEIIKEELKELPPRKKTSAKSVGGKTAHTYYLYNINNNNRDSSKAEVSSAPKGDGDIVVPASVELEAEKKAQQAEEQLEKLERERKSLENKFTELAKQRPMPPDFYDTQRKIGEKISSIETKIKQITPKVTKVVKQTSRFLTKFDQKRLTAALADKPDRARIADEIIFSICHSRGSLLRSKYGGNLSVSHGVSIALKLVREGRWETPKGMT